MQPECPRLKLGLASMRPDAHLNATTHTFSVTVLRARAGKLAVLAELQGLAPINNATDKKIALKD